MKLLSWLGSETSRGNRASAVDSTVHVGELLEIEPEVFVKHEHNSELVSGRGVHSRGSGRGTPACAGG